MLVCGWPSSFPVCCHINSWASWLVRNSVWCVTTTSVLLGLFEGGPKVSNFHLLLYAIFVGVYAGIKFFMIDFIFKSCPKLRDKYDTPYIVWANLPTDPQLKERNNASLSRRVSETVCRHIVPIWKACKISILNPLCRFVRRNSSVMTEMSNDFLL